MDTEYTDKVLAVVTRFEARIVGGEQKCAIRGQTAHVLMRRTRPSSPVTQALDVAGHPVRRSASKAKPKRKGGSRHANDKAAAANEEEEEALPEVLRLEDQPKCITGGRMRDYQVRRRRMICLRASHRRTVLPLNSMPLDRSRTV